ncbi:uncharacterized protein PFLUO_LOCUS441 [Penicillium psychrofluorescens]|uniref:uncharacterized protein n=1 Tax=Penicillium psychrofluorescens TaxID=3158075 RepID=UPI003CCD47A8
MPAQHPQSATTVFLDQPPSCLQFCPACPDYFVIGAYLLTETKDENGDIQQTKTGSLQLWHLDPVQKTLSQIQRLALPYAVFDLHFHPTHPNTFAIASSLGSVALFQVSTELSRPILKHKWTKQVHENPAIPALFLAWVPPSWFRQDTADGFAVTFSDSRTAVFGTERSLLDEDSIDEWGTFAARQMIEVWFVALSTYREPLHPDPTSGEGHDIPFMFTGDDFGSLQTRRFSKESSDSEAETEPLASLLIDHDDRSRHHTAGVTAILPLPIPLADDAPFLLTGSYDESLRVYHATRRGEVLAEQGLGGGVWRLQMLKTTPVADGWCFLVLASCMHAGTRVMRVSYEGCEWGIEVLAEFTEHESMNYASDVWKGPSESAELLCVSSSFYDRRVCVWTVDVR